MDRLHHVLVADDNPLVVASLCHAVTPIGHILVAVEDDQAAVEEAKRRRYDLVLLDVDTPGKDGVTACLEIIACQPDSVVVVMTLSSDACEYARRVGAKAVLNKLISIESLCQTIDRSLDSHRQVRNVAKRERHGEIALSGREPQPAFGPVACSYQ